MVDDQLRRPPAVVGMPWLAVLPPAIRLVFHGDAAARARALPVWGAAFAEEACRAHVAAARATLWLGPDEYLLLDSAVPTLQGGGHWPDIALALEAALGDTPHALVDVSHRQFALELSGPHATAILSAVCPLDLDLEEFPLNMCTRTVFSKADIVLWRTRRDAFHIEVWRSFSGYVSGILREVAREFSAVP